jgi:hypothetical protein
MRSNTQKWLILLLALVVCTQARADTPRTPFPWILRASHGHVFFAMNPPEENDPKNEGGHGVCYRLHADGTLEELWRTSGWYAFAGYLSDSGKYLVRFGPWAEDMKQHSDLAVAFYKDGQLIKQYRVNELVKDPKSLEYSVSHYSWLPARQLEGNGIDGNEFELTLIDKTVYYFNLDTGEITGTDIDPYAAPESVVDEEIDRYTDEAANDKE